MTKTHPKILTGQVVSVSGAKTIAVKVDRLIKHPKYGKRFIRSKKYLAHDETNRSKVGELVRIQETRPFSRRKTFKLI
ncbi:MAG: 30S ribosomal protein S17 [Patescibacteria group bacterium]